MAIKLTTVKREFAPDVTFPTEEGGLVQNRDLPSGEMVVCEVSLASLSQKTEYLGSYTIGNGKNHLEGTMKQFTVLQYDKCVSRLCKKITGLEDFGITTGRGLVAHEPTPELNDIIQEVFFKVNGIHADDMGENSSEGDGGEFTSEK